MREVFAAELLSKLRSDFVEATSRHEIASALAFRVGELVGCDAVVVRFHHPFSGAEWLNPAGSLPRSGELVTVAQHGGLEIDGALVELPLTINDVSRSRLDGRISSSLREHGILSLAVVPILGRDGLAGHVECRFYSRYYRWRKEDTLVAAQMCDYADLFAERLSPRPIAEAPARVERGSALLPAEDERGFADSDRYRYERLAEYGNLLIVRTDVDFSVTDVVGDTESILGVTPRALLDDPSVWRRFLPPEDLKALWRRVKALSLRPSELNEEICVIRQDDGGKRWLLVRATPIYSPDGAFTGWEGIGVDVTERRATQEELYSQSRRIEALYEVSSALQVDADPAVVALRGLKALIKATGSDAGLGCFCDRAAERFEIVAAEGLSSHYIDGIADMLGQRRSLMRLAVETRSGFLIDNLQRDSRAAVDLAKQEGLCSAIVIPLICEDQVLGAFGLFCRDEARYGDADYDLVTAAASQISMAARQAELYAAEREQASALAALYRLSHELSKHFTSREVAEHAFRIINEEIPCRRMWLGVINEQGSHIVGQAGFGPGLSNQIINVQVELELRHDFLDEALRRKEPVILPDGEPAECSGLNRIIKLLEPGTLVIMPLVSLGQPIGLMILEPVTNSPSFAQSKLPLLSSMGSEIAMVLLARRFEARMADADKMRMAAMLASGVAHNFNNLLQAVLGQASLIEMQLPAGSPLMSSARMIIDAANRGASLISHLLSFSTKDGRIKKAVSAQRYMEDSLDFYRSVLGSNIRLELDIEPELPEIFADYSQIQQAITNLLVNAKEAIIANNRSDGRVTVRARKVRLNTGDIDPDLAPGSYVRIDVQDNGLGMDEAQLSRCFEPFYTTKNTDAASGVGVSGSGLGLSSAYSIVRQHAGALTVESELGRGSRFSIYLPVASSKVKGVTESYATAGFEEAFDVLTLALDDAVGMSVRSFMQSCGLRTFVAGKRVEAVQALKRSGSVTRLLIMDVDRWGDESLNFIMSLRQENAKISVVILTSNQERWVELIAGVACIEVMPKPLSVWALHNIVGTLYGSASQLAQRIELARTSSDAGEEEGSAGELRDAEQRTEAP